MSKTQKAEDIRDFAADLSEIGDLKTQFDVIRFLKGVTELYGCSNFMVLAVPPVTSRELSDNTIVTNWPVELISLFDRHGLMQTSVVLERLRASTLAFAFDLDEITAEPPRPTIRELFSKFGLRRGACFPVHDAAGGRGALVLSGETCRFSHQQMMELSYVSAHVFERLARIKNVSVRTSDVLSEREVDCLNWTAAGKTSAEIAEILGLSEHTVNHYLNRAARKLDTVNRTQAVAKALRSGLIR